MKKCSKCQETKSTALFYKNKSKKDGLCTECKECQIAFNRSNRDKKRKYNIKYYNENKTFYTAYSREYWQKHAKQITYTRRVSGKANKWSADRRSAKLQRTPLWLTDDDRWVIKEIYTLAALRSEMTGIAWHVDHIIPLKGKMVSGLHVPSNLQIILGIENIRKFNKYDETT
jgi:hypothetical protein